MADDAPSEPTPAAIIQGVSIRSHVPVILDMTESNYGQWRCFFESALGKFGLASHVRSPTPQDDQDADRHMRDSAVVNWIFTTISKDVFAIVHKPDVSAYVLWHDVEGLFRDNELQRAVYLEAEFRSFVQGDLTITQYCARLKELADSLRDVGHPVSEPSQVLNLLRGLNPAYRHVKPVLKSKFPPHTFMSARSFLLLEEIQLRHDDKQDAGQAMVAAHGSPSTNGTPHSSPDPASNNRGRGRGGRRGRGRFSNTSSGRGHFNQPRPPSSPQPWASGYNPWTGLVQAWPMPFRAPGAGVLGPRPPFQPQQAMVAQGPTAGNNERPPPTYVDRSPTYEQAALYGALQSAGVPTFQPPSAAEWYMDTGASTHMTSSAGSSQPNGDSPM